MKHRLRKKEISIFVLFVFGLLTGFSIPGKNALRYPIKMGEFLSKSGNKFSPVENNFGVFISPTESDSVYSCRNGKVTGVGKLSDSSYVVIVQDRQKLQLRYLHLHDVKVKVNDIVNSGTLLGQVTKGKDLFFCVSKGLTYLNAYKYLVFY